jgi:hypothetical protein
MEHEVFWLPEPQSASGGSVKQSAARLAQDAPRLQAAVVSRQPADLRKNGETPEPGALDGEVDVRVFIQKGSIVPASICSDYACSSRPNLEG